jgi:hypothetical protein
MFKARLPPFLYGDMCKGREHLTILSVLHDYVASSGRTTDLKMHYHVNNFPLNALL